MNANNVYLYCTTVKISYNNMSDGVFVSSVDTYLSIIIGIDWDSRMMKCRVWIYYRFIFTMMHQPY